MEISLSFKRSEKRSSDNTSGLKNPYGWLTDLFGGTTSVTVNHKTALSYAAYWNAVTMNARVIGSLSFEVYEYTEAGRQVRRDHPVYRLIHNRVSSYLSSQKFRETMELLRQNWGNAYAIIRRAEGSGHAIALDIIHPSRVEPIVSNGKKFYRVQGLPELVDDINMIHLMGPSLDGIKGLSTLAYHAETIGLGLLNRNHSKKFFENGGFFKGFLKLAGKLENTQKAEDVSKAFDEKWGGAGNAFRTPVLQNGTEYVPIGIPQKDAQLLEEKRFSIEEIARITDTPLHLIHANDKTSYSSQEAMNLIWVQNNIRPKVKEWEEEFHYKLLLGDYELQTWINLESLLRADSKTRTDKNRVMFNAGALSPDEWRDQEGMNPRPDGGGKKYFTPVFVISDKELDLNEEKKEKENELIGEENE